VRALWAANVKDPVLIPRLASERLVWITKDDEAKRAHIKDIRKHGISVVWCRGLDRDENRGNRVTAHELHLMLTVKLRYIAEVVSITHTAVHHELYLHGGGVAPSVSCKRLDPERVSAKASLKRARLT